MSESDHKRVLLTFIGFHDPFFIGSADGEQREGPVLNLVRELKFDVLVLIGTPNTDQRTKDAIVAIGERQPNVEVVHQHIELTDPSDYFEVLPGVRSVLRDVRELYPDGQYFIGTASGTPQMHTCWVMLSASGEFPARLLQSRPKRFVTEDRPPISEIDPTNDQFPIIRQNVWANLQREQTEPQNYDPLIQRLGIVGDHHAIKEALQQACDFGQSNYPVLILGESGTGKELFARLVHAVSERSKKPFVRVNCSAIQENLAESALFGHKKGAFTDAISDRVGKFEEANGGTIFLDELGELPTSIQAKLLRTIQNGEIEPVGGKMKTVDVRIVAATNRKLSANQSESNFREDLYFRLSVCEIRLPSLRTRRSDITKLAMTFLDRECKSLRKSKSLAPEAVQKLEAYNWPGNIRELENTIQRAVILSKGTEIEPDHVQVNLETEDSSLQHLPTPQDGFSLSDYVGRVRESLYDKALELADGSQKRTAELLGVSDNAVSKYVKAKREGEST